MQVYGQLIAAQIENLTGDPAGVNLVTGRMWYRTDTGTFKVYDGSGVQEFVDLATAQTMTNKTLTAPTITNPTITGGGSWAGSPSLTTPALTDPSVTGSIQLNEIATPATPAAGLHKIYFKADNKLYTLDDAGNEAEVGSGAGGGGVNIFPNPDWNISIADASTYDDGAVDTPVDGTGGSPTAVTISHETTTPLRGAGSLRISKSASDGQGEGVSVSIVTEESDKNNVREVYFEYRASANFVNDDIRPFLYDVDNAAIIEPEGTVEVQQRLLQSSDVRMFKARYLFTDSDNYRMIFHTRTVNPLAYALDIDEVRVGDILTAPGIFMSDWVEYTPTTNGLTAVPSFEVARYRQVGNSIDLMIRMTITSRDASELRIGLPSGMTGRTGDSTNATVIGESVGTGGSVSDIPVLLTDGDAYLNFGADKVITPQGASSVLATSSTLTFSVSVPINELEIGAQLAPNEVETVKVSAYKNGGSITNGTTIASWTAEDKDTHNAFDISTGVFTSPKDTDYIVGVWLRQTSGVAGVARIKVNGIAVRSGQTNSAFANKEVVSLISVSKGDTIEFDILGNATLFSDNISNHISIVEIPDFKIFSTLSRGAIKEKAYLSGNQSVANGTTPVRIDFDAIEFGNASNWNLATGVYTAIKNSTYHVRAQNSWEAYAVGGPLSGGIYVNGVLSLQFRQAHSGNNQVSYSEVDGYLELTVGDTVEYRAFHSRGSSANAQGIQAESWMSIIEVN